MIFHMIFLKKVKDKVKAFALLSELSCHAHCSGIKSNMLGDVTYT